MYMCMSWSTIILDGFSYLNLRFGVQKGIIWTSLDLSSCEIALTYAIFFSSYQWLTLFHFFVLSSLDLEVIVIDDNSPDHTQDVRNIQLF